MDQETHARITTLLALRNTVKSYEDFKATANEKIASFMRCKKSSRKNMVMLFDKMLDDAFSGNLISKLIVKDSERKTSKHMAHKWLYLHYDPERPYTRREEHLIEVYGTEMITNAPSNFIDYRLNIFVARHLLERAALRLKAVCIEDMVGFLNVYVVAMMNKSVRDACDQNNGLVLVTKNEYVIVHKTELNQIILKTFLPYVEWSKTKKARLLNITNNLSTFEAEEDVKKGDVVAVISVDDFNREGQIDLDEASFLILRENQQ